MTLHCDEMTGCYGPSELKRMGQVFDEVWAEVGPDFRNASPEFTGCARNGLALDILRVRCDTVDELRLRVRAAFLRRFAVAALYRDGQVLSGTVVKPQFRQPHAQVDRTGQGAR